MKGNNDEQAARLFDELARMYEREGHAGTVVAGPEWRPGPPNEPIRGTEARALDVEFRDMMLRAMESVFRPGDDAEAVATVACNALDEIMAGVGSRALAAPEVYRRCAAWLRSPIRA